MKNSTFFLDKVGTPARGIPTKTLKIYFFFTEVGLTIGLGINLFFTGGFKSNSFLLAVHVPLSGPHLKVPFISDLDLNFPVKLIGYVVPGPVLSMVDGS